jgi:hypothetical protein
MHRAICRPAVRLFVRFPAAACTHTGRRASAGTARCRPTTDLHPPPPAPFDLAMKKLLLAAAVGLLALASSPWADDVGRWAVPSAPATATVEA